MTDQAIYDLAIIGGGINGCGIARDAVGRGLSVYLCEQGDLAQATSSASTKLIHGGLRYLEYYEFRLVREALIEREVLLNAAPHIIWPLRFVLPHVKGLRPAWLLRLGLFLYDHLGGRKLLPGTRGIDLRHDAAGAPLRDGFGKGFEYSDCWVEDARLVVMNAMDAADRGAVIETRTRCVGAQREDGLWVVSVTDTETGLSKTLRARAIVNAAGPWVEDVLTTKVKASVPARIRMVRGSHVVVPKIFEHDRAYIFQNPDGRIIFSIPYEHDFTLIGTTDQDHKGDPAAVHCTEDEAQYLCDAASEYFKRPIRREDVVWTYSGVRPLYDDGASAAQAATRDYVLKLEDAQGAAPLLSIFGGKITTFRKLAESALEKLIPYFPGKRGPWTDKAVFPGGDFSPTDVWALIAALKKEYPFLDDVWARRLVRAYGTRARHVLGDATSAADMGEAFGATLTEREVLYLMRKEWAREAADIVWRRSKLGLRLTADQIARLDLWMRSNRGQVSPAAE